MISYYIDLIDLERSLDVLSGSPDEYESLESDPFAFLQLAYDFNIEDQIKKAIDCIALSVHQASPGKIHGDVLQFAQLARRILQLPSGLPARIWNRRNQINERTDQFDRSPLVDRAE